MTEIKVGDKVKFADRQIAIQHEDGHLQIVHMIFLRPCDNRADNSANWKVGDWVECVEKIPHFTEGKLYKVVNSLDTLGRIAVINDEGNRHFLKPKGFRWVDTFS